MPDRHFTALRTGKGTILAIGTLRENGTVVAQIGDHQQLAKSPSWERAVASLETMSTTGVTIEWDDDE